MAPDHTDAHAPEVTTVKPGGLPPITGAQLRNLLNELLPKDEELTAFLLDRFPAVHRELSGGMARTQRINLLFDKTPDLGHIQTELFAWKEQSGLAGGPASSGTPSWVQLFLDEYLGTSGRTVAFAGRDDEQRRLLDWVTGESPSYALVTAPLGMGKSALVARLCAALRQQRSEWQGVLVPLGPLWGIERRDEILHALGSELARAQGRALPALSPLELREQIAKWLTDPLPRRRVLVILDGLDEVADELRAALRLPQELPPHVRILLTVRDGQGDLAPDALLGQLGLPAARPKLRMRLGTLTRAEIEQTLGTLPVLSDSESLRSAKVELAPQLLRLTEGDPLLLQLYLRELQGAPVLALVASLRDVQPGIDAYFERIWSAQRAQWRERERPLSRLAEEVLALLASALGPLSLADVEQLLPPELEARGFSLHEALRPLSRWLRGAEVQDGLALAHPLLTKFFRERFVLPAEAQRWESRILAFGERTLAALREQHPMQVSAYLVRHLGVHMERAGVPIAAMAALVDRCWQQACFAQTQSNAAFLTDVERVRAAAESADRREIAAGRPAPYLGERLRCMLFAASVASRAMQVPPELLIALVERGGWSIERAATEARLTADLSQRAEVLALLASRAPEAQAQELWREALHAAASIDDPHKRSDCLAPLFRQIPTHLRSLREQLLRRELSHPLHADMGAAAILTNYLPFLPDSEKERAGKAALDCMGAIIPPAGQAHLLANLAAEAPQPLRAELLRQLDDLTAQLFPYVAIEVFGIVPERRSPAHFQGAEAAAYAITTPLFRGLALSALAVSEWSPVSRRPTLAQGALAALIEHEKNPEAPLSLMRGVPTDLPVDPGLRSALRTFNKSMGNAIFSADAERLFLNLTYCLPDEDLPRLGAVAAKHSFGQDWLSEKLRARIAARLRSPEVDVLFSQLRMAEPTVRYACLVSLTPALSSERLQEALGLCYEIGDWDACHRFVVERAKTCAVPELIQRHLARISALNAIEERMSQLEHLLAVLPVEGRALIEPRLHAELMQLRRPQPKLDALLRLLPYSGQAQVRYLSEALELVQQLPDMPAASRIQVLAKLLGHSPPETAPQLVEQVLNALDELQGDWHYDASPASWIGYASFAQRKRLLDRARDTQTPSGLAYVLETLLPHTTGDERLQCAEQLLRLYETLPTSELHLGLKDVVEAMPECTWPRLRKLALRLTRMPPNSLGPLLGRSLLVSLLRHQPDPAARAGLLLDVMRLCRENTEDKLPTLVDIVPFLADRPSEQASIINRILRMLEAPRSFLEAHWFHGLESLVAQLSEGQVRKAWAGLLRLAEQGMNWEGYLRVLLPRLPLDLLEQAARMAGSARISTELQRQDLLQIISSRIGELPLAKRYELAEQVLAGCAARSRQDLLSMLDASWGILAATAATDLAGRTVDALFDAVAAFP